MNLLETLSLCLKRNNKDISQILWVGCESFEIPLNVFFDLASKTEDCFISEVADDLVVVGEDFLVERIYIDNSADEWLFKNKLKRPEKKVILKTLDKRDLNEYEYERLLKDKRIKDSEIIIGSELWMMLYKQ